MPNISDQFADVMTGHTVDLLRASESVRNDVIANLEALKDDLARTMQTFEVAGLRASLQFRRAEALFRQTDATIRSAYREANATLKSQLLDLAQIESAATLNLSKRVFGSNLLSQGLGLGQLKQIASNNLINGSSQGAWWAKQSNDTSKRFADQVRLGLLAGEDNDAIVARILGKRTGRKRIFAGGKSRIVRTYEGGIMQVSEREATALVRTSVMTVANDTRMATYMENADVINGVQALVTLDTRTSDICKARSGMAWELPDQDSPTGKNLGFDPDEPKKGPEKRGVPNPKGKDSIEQWIDPKTGEFTPERKALHDKIVAEAFEGVPEVENPTVYMMGGGPASGKSVLMNSGNVKLPAKHVLIDPDEIKKKLPEFKALMDAKDSAAAAFVHEESSMLSKRIAAEMGKRNAVWDGTGDNSIESLTRKVRLMRANGHRVVANYVTVDTEVALARNIARAKQTGRMVPESYVRQTHSNVSRVFSEAIEAGLFDEAYLWDTNDYFIYDAVLKKRVKGTTIRLVAEQQAVGKHRIKVLDTKLWEDFRVKAHVAGGRKDLAGQKAMTAWWETSDPAVRRGLKRWTSAESLASIRTQDAAGKLRGANKKFMEGIRSAPKSGGTVYRGITFSDAELEVFLAKLERGGVMELDSLQSFTHSPSIAQSYAPVGEKTSVLLKVKMKSGVDINHKWGNHIDEEVLLMKGTKFRLVSKKATTWEARAWWMKRKPTPGYVTYTSRALELVFEEI